MVDINSVLLPFANKVNTPPLYLYKSICNTMRLMSPTAAAAKMFMSQIPGGIKVAVGVTSVGFQIN